VLYVQGRGLLPAVYATRGYPFAVVFYSQIWEWQFNEYSLSYHRLQWFIITFIFALIFYFWLSKNSLFKLYQIWLLLTPHKVYLSRYLKNTAVCLNYISSILYFALNHTSMTGKGRLVMNTITYWKVFFSESLIWPAYWNVNVCFYWCVV